jgi:NADH:ubiquinone reductase (H+-translocating)
VSPFDSPSPARAFPAASRSGALRAGEPPHVVILGGGFGGLYAARALKKASVRVTLIDHHNHHLFQPLLYQVATAALDPSDIAVPIRRIFRHQTNCTVLLAKVTGIDAAAKQVILSDGAVPYDYLILATGATHSYFGHNEWAAVAPGLKTIDDAFDIRRRILYAYEAAERELDAERQQEWLNFAVVGAGPTGVELAGALGEISRHVMALDFRRIDARQARVLLIEAGTRVLPSFSPELSDKAAKKLAQLGVEVLLGKPVEAIDPFGVTVDGKRIRARTVLWAAGVAASPVARSLNVPLDRVGRVIVRPDLTVPGVPGVFAIGDIAVFIQDGKPLPGVAPVAIQQGRWAAQNIMRAAGNQELLPFHYRDRGTLATIGREAAIAERGRVKVAGFWAWVLWLFVHILWLIGFRNRFFVVAEWAWSYFRYERGVRLITGDVYVYGKTGASQSESCVIEEPFVR